MKLFSTVKGLVLNIKSSYKRFPLTSIFLKIAAMIFIYEIIRDHEEYMYLGLFFIFLAGNFLFLHLFSEGLKYSVTDEETLTRNKRARLVAYLLDIPIILTMFLIIYNSREVTPKGFHYTYFGVMLALIIGCFFVAKLFYHKDYTPYVFQIFSSISIAIIYSIFLYVGVSSIFLLITYLFSLPSQYKIYLITFVIMALVFGPDVLLSSFPKVANTYGDYEFTKVAKVLLVYIIMPVLIIYMAVIYLYFGKILIVREIPKNQITNLVLWYSIASVGFLFVISELKGQKFVDKFRKFYPIFMLPLLGFMFVSMGIRIGHFGITENRYFVVVLGIWSTLSMFHYIFYKNSTNITIPIMLFFIVLFSTIGPTSAYSLSSYSQSSKLKKVLERNNMLVDNKIIPKADVPNEDKIEIQNLVRYASMEHELSEFPYLPSDYKRDNFDKVFGFTYYYEKSDSEEKYLYYDISPDEIMDIEGYSNMLMVSDRQEDVGRYHLNKANNVLEVSLYSKDGSSLEKFFTIDYKELYAKLISLNVSNQNISSEDLVMEGENLGISYKIIFNNISFYNLDEKMEGDISFYLLTNRSGVESE